MRMAILTKVAVCHSGENREPVVTGLLIDDGLAGSAIHEMTPMSYRSWPSHCRIALVAVLLPFGSGAESVSPSIRRAEAKELVAEAIKMNNAGADILSYANPRESAFYFFVATWPNPRGSPIIGYYAVNRHTGDVWETGGHCTRIYTSSLIAMQSTIQKRLKLGQSAISRERERRPLCSAGEDDLNDIH